MLGERLMAKRQKWLFIPDRGSLYRNNREGYHGRGEPVNFLLRAGRQASASLLGFDADSSYLIPRLRQRKISATAVFPPWFG
jgi:hypothetical protein